MDIPINCIQFFLELNSVLYEQKLLLISARNNCLDKKVLPRDLQLFRKLDMYQNDLNSQRTNQKTSKDAHKITCFANKRITRGPN